MDVIAGMFNAVLGAFAAVFDTLRSTPGGFGLILVPLAILGFLTFLATRR